MPALKIIWSPACQIKIHLWLQTIKNLPDDDDDDDDDDVTGFLSPGTFPLEPVVHPTTQASISDCSTSLLCAMSLVQLLFVDDQLNTFLVLF
jgi:hypothetical protein